MGLRFRKSIRVAPGIKLNIGKKSAGISLGGKHGGMSFNTRSGARARVSAPGTGLSYSTKIDRNSEKSTTSTSNTKNTNTTASSGKSNGGGCLVTCLKILGIFILIPFAIVFGWIAGIVWLIAFRKKMAGEPEKQKKYTIGVSVLSVISLIFMINCFGSPSEPAAESSSEITTSTELDTETDQEINHEEPKPTEFDMQAVETEQTEKDNGADTELESNTDKTPKSDEAAALNSSTVVTQTPDEQIHDKQEQVISSQEEQNSVMVWIDDTSKKYHRKQDCSGMDNAYQVTKEQAKSMGKEPCGRCYK